MLIVETTGIAGGFSFVDHVGFMKKQFWVVLMTLALSACGGEGPAPKVMHSAPEGNWITGQQGALQHVASGIGFPGEIGTYSRVKVVDFAPDGTDVGIVYKAEKPKGAAVSPELTLYVTYFTAGTAEAYLNSASQAIVDRFQGVQLVQEGMFTPDGGPDVLKGPFRLFRFPHND